MRAPRVRFTVRWMMVAVATLAMIGGVVRCAKSRAECLRRAEDHAFSEALYREQVENAKDGLEHARRGTANAEGDEAMALFDPTSIKEVRDFWVKETARWESMLAAFRRLRDHHSKLARKYTGAASRPWSLVSPDPPEPPRPEPSFSTPPHLRRKQKSTVDGGPPEPRAARNAAGILL